MGDSSDEWDASDDDEAAEKLRKEVERRKKNKERGLDSDYESEEEEAPPAPDPSLANKPPPPKQKSKKEMREEAEKSKVVEEVLTAEQIKLRQRALEEEANEKAAMDLFGSCTNSFAEEKKAKEAKKAEEAKKAAAAKPKIVTVDVFASLQLDVQDDVSNLCKKVCEKIQKGTCKGGANKFIIDLLKQVEDSLATKELAALEKLLEDVLKEKKKPQGATVVKQNKSTKIQKNMKFNQGTELDDMYGENDEDWSKEEWDEWNAQQGKSSR